MNARTINYDAYMAEMQKRFAMKTLASLITRQKTDVSDLTSSDIYKLAFPH